MIGGSIARAFLDELPADCEPRDIPEKKSDTRSPAARTLARAASIIDGERDRSHGDRHESHRCIANLWTAYLDGYEFTSQDVAIMLALMKIARMKTGDGNGDNFIDAAGYLALAGELAEGNDHGC